MAVIDNQSLTTTTTATRVRWYILGILFAFGVLAYSARSAISVVAPFVEHDLHLNAVQFGVILSIFYAGYAPAALVGGWASDRWGPRKAFGLASLIWSVFTIATAAAIGVISMSIIRVFFGAGEGPQNTITAKTVKRWFPDREAGTAMGAFSASYPIGGAITAPLVALLLSLSPGNWRLPFIVLGALGLLATFGWFTVMRDHPELHPWVNGQEVAHITAGTGEDEDLNPHAGDIDTPAGGWAWLAHARDPQIIGIAIAFFGYAWLLYVFLSWFPSYLIQVRHLNLDSVAWANTLPWVGGVIGSVVGGALADALIHRYGRPVVIRRRILVIGLALAAALFVVVTMIGNLALAVAVMTVVVLLLYIANAQFFTLLIALLPDRHYGSVTGAVHGFANLAGVISPLVTGALIAGSTPHWNTAFAIATVLGLAGAAFVALTGRRHAPVAR